MNKLFDKIGIYIFNPCQAKLSIIFLDLDENSQLDKKEIVTWSRSLEQKYMDKEITEWVRQINLTTVP